MRTSDSVHGRGLPYTALFIVKTSAATHCFVQLSLYHSTGERATEVRRRVRAGLAFHLETSSILFMALRRFLKTDVGLRNNI